MIVKKSQKSHNNLNNNNLTLNNNNSQSFNLGNCNDINQLIVNDSNINRENRKHFHCSTCNYSTINKYDYNKHLFTQKHIKLNTTKEEITNTNKFICSCGKEYKYDSGYYRHKKQCKNQKSLANNIITENNNEKSITPELVLELIKNNNELTNTINNLVKNGITNNYITNNNNNNHSNSHNKTFNLQVFLNETCKDAMNINEFVDSIKLQLSDFERMGEVGYAQGISDIITSNLQALDITQRPVHCTDKKRETMYVKEQDQWMKEDDDKSKIKKMIKRIENKNIQFIPQFQKKYPNYANPKSHESDKYHKTIIEVMGGPGGSEGKEGKIIRNISKVTTVREKE